jgi:succinoglycan biosynthesis transport protein ExoP
MPNRFLPHDELKAEGPVREIRGATYSQPSAGGRLDDMDIGAFYIMLRRHGRLILGVVAATLVVALIAMYYEQPIYQSSAVLRLAGARDAVAGGFERVAEESETDPFLSELELLRSRTLAGQVVDAEGLRLRSLSKDLDARFLRAVHVSPDARPDTLQLTFSESKVEVRANERSSSGAYGAPLTIEGVRLTVAEHPGTGEAEVEILPREIAIDLFLENLIASSRQPTNIIDVHYTSSDPESAQRVLNRLITSFQVANAERARQQASRRREFLATQIARTDSTLAAAQLRLSGFRSRERVYSTRDKLQAEQATLTELQIRRRALGADAGMYRSLLSRVERARPGQADAQLQTLLSASGVVSNPVLAQIHEELTTYQREREALTTGRWGASSRHPDVVRLDALIASARTRLTTALRSQLAALNAQTGALRGLESRSATAGQTLPETEAEEVRLVQQVETVRGMGDRLREDYQRAEIAAAVELGQVEIVDSATLPHEPANFGRALKFGLAALLGLLLGGAAALLLEWLNPAVRQYREITSSFDLPQLAVIPRIQQPSNGHKRLTPGRFRTNGVALIPRTHEPLADVAPLTLLPAPNSPAEEAFRALRINLMFSPQSRSARTFAVTSAFPQEGKSITASSLATAFAQQGVRTLLVDADLRRPRLHMIFDMVQSPGLSGVLDGTVKIGEAMRPTSVDNLYVLTSGSPAVRPAELLAGDRMRTLLRELPDHIDLLIVDTPPLLAAPEAAVLAAEADAVLLVVRAGRTARGAVKQAVEQLATVGAQVVGAVLNDPDMEVTRYGDYYSAYGAYGNESAGDSGYDDARSASREEVLAQRE